MWTALIPILLQALPSIVSAVETLFGKQPKSGAAKLNAGTQMVIQGLTIAHVIDPAQIGDPEVALAQDIQNAIVKYNNARGIFSKSS